uniref:Uncharacterized protein n=1 Tax=Torque teno mini virus 10 TaxID=2065036 RepID=A0A3S8RKF6_9VIRU|nr:hypothetical protein ORF3 [Torque teno mini virus 10]
MRRKTTNNYEEVCKKNHRVLYTHKIFYRNIGPGPAIPSSSNRERRRDDFGRRGATTTPASSQTPPRQAATTQASAPRVNQEPKVRIIKLKTTMFGDNSQTNRGLTAQARAEDIIVAPAFNRPVR